jgi:GNAT superfamily N-acetyltransferase
MPRPEFYKIAHSAPPAEVSAFKKCHRWVRNVFWLILAAAFYKKEERQSYYDNYNIPARMLGGVGFMQRVLGFNRHVPWPVHFTSQIVCAERIKRPVGHSTAGWSSGCYIQAINGLELGKYIYFAPGVRIVSANHDPNDLRSHLPAPPIKIGDHCWIGANVVLLPGVQLGPRTIVGAGSIVTKSFPEGNCVIVGNPARLLRRTEPGAAEEETEAATPDAATCRRECASTAGGPKGARRSLVHRALSWIPRLRLLSAYELRSDDSWLGSAEVKDVQLEPVTAANVAEVVAWRGKHVAQEFSHFLDSEHIGVFAKCNGAVVGHAWVAVSHAGRRLVYGYMPVTDHIACIYFCSVADGYRNRKIFQRMIGHLVDRCRAIPKLTQIDIYTDIDNAASRAAIERVGFHWRGTRLLIEWRGWHLRLFRIGHRRGLSKETVQCAK